MRKSDNEALENVLIQMNSVFELLNRIIANFEWQTFKNSTIVSPEVYTYFVQLKLKWRSRLCAELMNVWNNGVPINEKLLHFLCKGPKYTPETARYGKLSQRSFLIIKAIIVLINDKLVLDLSLYLC